MSSGFPKYLTDISTALALQDGNALAHLLDPFGQRAKQLLRELHDSSQTALAQYRNSIKSPWDEIAIAHVQVIVYCIDRDFLEAYNAQRDLVQAFLRFFISSTSWTLPALYGILRDLRDLAYKADIAAFQEGRARQSMEDAARVCNKAFSNCVTDRTSPYDKSRKWGIFYAVGLALKCYFKINRIALSKNIIRAIRAQPDIPPLSSYPLAHQVTYRYYLGIISFLNEEFKQSEEDLAFVFYHCPLSESQNQERALTYLIPLRMLLGQLPSQALLSRFPALHQLYAPFIHAIRKGDLRLYHDSLAKSEIRLADIGVLLAVEKAREICLRGLFRKVWLAFNCSTRIPISAFHAALSISGLDDVTAEEAECLVANLIFKNFIRGYISHEKQMVVLANNASFPRPSERTLPFI